MTFKQPIPADLIAGIPNAKISTSTSAALESLVVVVSTPKQIKTYIFEDNTNMGEMKRRIDADFKPLEQTQ